jgi:flagellar basal-body rod modification protein FlgD
MNEIQASTGTTQRITTASSRNAPAGLASDFETFLKMLTAQARYQDPLEPIDSTEYAAQLAQFSMVEQQVQTNDALSRLQQELGVSTLATLSGWIGKEARAEMPAHFSGSPVTVFPNVAPGATRAQLVVTGADGTELQRLTLPATDEPFQWTGLTDEGTQLPHGSYTLSIESFNQDQRLSEDPPEIYARIKEAQSQHGQSILFFEGGHSVPAKEVTALRDPA